jgi:hypothetical protein
MDTDHNMQTNPEVSYEPRDLGARNIFLFFAVLFISGVIIHFIVWGVYGFFDKEILQAQPVSNPMKPYEQTPRAELLQNTPMVNLDKFSEPRLQDDEPADMRTFDRMENNVLDGQAWVDAKGTVHLPIQAAMDEILKRGLPTRAAGAATPAAPAPSRAGGKEQNAPGTTKKSQ